MSRARSYLLVAVALLLVGGVAYLAHRSRPQRLLEQEGQPLAGLDWLPAEAGLVAGANLAEVREQGWLLALLAQAAAGVEEGPDYRAFVEATGFDYSRDLDRLWVGVFGPSQQPVVVGVAEGRFARDKIVLHARRQGAVPARYQGFEVYQVKTGSGSAAGFAFAFLDDAHLAFASNARAAALVVDCWRGQAPAVGADGSRRAAIERVAAGRQVWAVDDLVKWQPKAFVEQEALQALVVEASLAVKVNVDGVEAVAEARCREARQAERLRDNLRIVALAARLALGRQRDRSSQALADALAGLTLDQEGDVVRARFTLPPELLAVLLGLPAPTPAPQR